MGPLCNVPSDDLVPPAVLRKAPFQPPWAVGPKSLSAILIAVFVCPAYAQRNKLLDIPTPKFALPQASIEKIALSAECHLETGSKKGRITVTADIAEGWHTFSTTQRVGGPKPSKIESEAVLVKLTGPFVPDLTVVYLVQIVDPDYRIATLILLVVVSFACWLIGRVPSYSETKRFRNAWLLATSIVALATVICFTLFGPIKHYLTWEPYNEAQLTEYRREGKTVLIEFTARWCPTCQTNMLFAIDRERVADVCKQNNVIAMLADKSRPSPLIDRKLHELGSASIPLLAIYPPDSDPIVLRDTLTQSQLIVALEQAGPSRLVTVR